MESSDLENYIRNAATLRGIDPDQAMRVSKSEGFDSYVGDNGSSFGPFQLHYGGVAPGGNRVGGLGDEFTKATGLDARDRSTVPQQVDFALDHASKNGWGAWHGWRGDPWAGINGNQNTQTASASPSALPGTASAPTPAAPAPQPAASGTDPLSKAAGLLGQARGQPQQLQPAQFSGMNLTIPQGALALKAALDRLQPQPQQNLPPEVAQNLIQNIGNG